MATVKTWFKAKHPPTIPKAFYPPLGRLMQGWTFTELYMQSVIWRVMNVRDAKRARMLTWGRNANELTTLFLSLERWLPPAQKAEHKAIHTEADRLRAARNQLAHGPWGYRPGAKPKNRVWRIYYLRDYKHKLDPKATKYTPAEVEKLADDLDTLNLRLKAFHKKLGARTP